MLHREGPPLSGIAFQKSSPESLRSLPAEVIREEKMLASFWHRYFFADRVCRVNHVSAMSFIEAKGLWMVRKIADLKWGDREHRDRAGAIDSRNLDQREGINGDDRTGTRRSPCLSHSCLRSEVRRVRKPIDSPNLDVNQGLQSGSP